MVASQIWKICRLFNQYPAFESLICPRQAASTLSSNHAAVDNMLSWHDYSISWSFYWMVTFLSSMHCGIQADFHSISSVICLRHICVGAVCQFMMTVGAFELAYAAGYPELLLQFRPFAAVFGVISMLTAILAESTVQFDHILKPARWCLLCSMTACLVGLCALGSGLYTATGYLIFLILYATACVSLATLIILVSTLNWQDKQTTPGDLNHHQIPTWIMASV